MSHFTFTIMLESGKLTPYHTDSRGTRNAFMGRMLTVLFSPDLGEFVLVREILQKIISRKSFT